LFSLLCGLLVGQAMRLDVPHPVLLLAFLLLCVGWYQLTRERERAVAFFRRLRGA
jgi:UDP-GlcNAc:undecaprenyl-phosphate GlcNAc-1-phosphate transferase